MKAEPILTLSFYDFGIILNRQDGHGGRSEYAVHPDQVAQVLAAEARFETGLLGSDVLFVSQEGVKHVVVTYRPPQLTGVWLEGLEEPYRIPLPGLVLARTTRGSRPDYQFFAVAERPITGDEDLYVAPLPHISSRGLICWGSVRVPDGEAIKSTDMSADWDQLLGSRFGNHTVGGKSKLHKDDIRSLYPELEASGAAEYPLDDLVLAGKPVKVWLKELAA